MTNDQIKKLFIDESGTNLKVETDILTYCALYGSEQDINKKYELYVNLLKKELPSVFSLIKKERELKYSKIYGDMRDKAISLLNKCELDFKVIYTNKETISHFKVGTTKDQIRKHMCQLLILDYIEDKTKINERISFVIFDKEPFSGKSFKDIQNSINKEMKHQIKFNMLNSKTKYGLQIADLITGSARAHIKDNKHYNFFEKHKNKLYLLQDSHKINIMRYSTKLSETSLKQCFYK